MSSIDTAEFERLREELFWAKEAIINLMPEDLRKILNSYYLCNSKDETNAWLEKIAKELIAKAAPIHPKRDYSPAEHAYCPLCGSGSLTPYQSGFILPEGLRRHLIGWRGRKKQCDVVRAAVSLAHESWSERFPEQQKNPRQ